MKKRILNIEGVINFRDIGGYEVANQQHVVWGKVYRSGQLDRLSEQGVQQMTELEIHTVVDLRFSEETERYPTMREAFPQAEFMSWRSELAPEQQDETTPIQRSWRESLDTGDAAQVREAMRLNYPQKLYSHKGVYRQMMLRLAKHDSPLLFHCAAGKDRTGVAAALILGVLGVSNDDIIADYLVSQSQVSALLELWAAGGAVTDQQYDDFQSRLARYPRELVQPVFDADVSYIDTLMDYVEQRYNGFTQYALTTLALSESDLTAVKKALLV